MASLPINGMNDRFPGPNVSVGDIYTHDMLINGNGGVGSTSNAYQIIADVSGDGSNESGALQAAFDAAALLRTNGRPVVVIPPGLTINIGSANLTLLNGIDFDMRGSKLTSLVASGAALTIGADGYANEDGYALGIYITRDYGAANDNYLYSETIGCRLINILRYTVLHQLTTGFRRAFQLRAAFGTVKQAGYCAYNHIYLGRMAGKYGLSLLNADRYDASFGSWINANTFHEGDFFFLPGANVGRVAGVLYEMGLTPANMPLDGQAMQDNVFIRPVFQVGGYQGEPGFVSGGNVPSGDVGRCYAVGEYSYICTQAGDFGTTTLTDLSTTPGDTITSGTAQFYVEGLYVRSPFIFDRCGYSMRCRDPYWETGVGPFMHMIGKTAGSGHRVTGVYLGGPVTNCTRLVGDRTGDREDWDWTVSVYNDSFSKLNNLVEMAPQSGQTVQTTGQSQLLRSEKWHRRFIKGQAYWQASGMAARYADTLWPKLASDYRLGDGCLILGGGAYNQYGVIVPTDQYKRFRITANQKSGDSIFSGLAFLALDAALAPIDIGTDTTSSPAVMADRGTIGAAGSTNLMTTGRDNWECWVCVADAVKFIHISTWWGFAADAMDGIEVEVFLDDYATRAQPLSFHEPFTSSVEARRSDGAPTQGYFMTRGEYIANTDASGTTDAVNGWLVTTAGILAPAFVTGAAVYTHELRSNAGNVYAANSSFTSGATAPTGTGSAISDGTGTWKYVAAEAVLSDILQYRPHDSRADYDYTPYHVGTFDLTTDTNSDGFCDGVSADPYGTQTNITYTHTSTSSRQGFEVVRAAGSSDGAGERIVFDATMADGDEYFLIVKGNVVNANPTLPGFWIALHDSITDNHIELTQDAYAPDGYVQSPIGQAKSNGDVILASRFTAPTGASAYGISVMQVQWAFPSAPQTHTAYVDTLWLIDIAAAETALGISLAGLTAGELYAIINTALTVPPPTGLRLTDTVTGNPVTLSVASGSLVIT